MRPSASAQAGFTLLEIMVALALTATVLVGMFISLRSVLGASVELDRGGETSANGRMLLSLLKRDLLSLSDADDGQPGPLLQLAPLAFGVDRPILRLSCASSLRSDLLPAVRVVEYYLDEGSQEGHYRLFRRELPATFEEQGWALVPRDGEAQTDEAASLSMDPWTVEVGRDIARFSVSTPEGLAWDSRPGGRNDGLLPEAVTVILRYSDSTPGQQEWIMTEALEAGSVFAE